MRKKSKVGKNRTGVKKKIKKKSRTTIDLKYSLLHERVRALEKDMERVKDKLGITVVVPSMGFV